MNLGSDLKITMILSDAGRLTHLKGFPVRGHHI
jgi:hypothetical protein